jgi:thiamine biosynthesis lipoprotein
MISLAAAAFLAAASVTRARYLMGTVCEISVPPSPAAQEQIEGAFTEAARIERFLSTWRDDSELSSLNAHELRVVSPELRDLLRQSVEWAHATGGAFNPLVKPLLDAWRIRDGGAVPDDVALAAATSRADLNNIAFGESVELRNGAQVEEGAFGKGYALDRMLLVLRSRGATAALINFGGQIASYNAPQEVAIADPEHRERPKLSVTLSYGSISTSSGSEKSFAIAGRRFTHIVDPRTGDALPPRGSVSVIHESALVADVLSTALYVMGPAEGVRWARDHNVTAIFITDSGQIITSKEVH